MLMSLFVAELLFYTWCRVQCTRTGYDIAQATRRHINLMALQQNLNTEAASLKAPDRIKKIALKQLGLVMPVPE